MEDAQIVALYWARDEAALAESEQKYGGYCRAIALGILENREDAAECVNDTWLRAWKAMPPRRPARLDAFLGKLTRNLSLDRWRALRAQKRGGGQTELALSELEECLPAVSTPEHALEAQDLAESLNRFLEALPREKRVLFVQRYWYLRSVEELAAGGRSCGVPGPCAAGFQTAAVSRLHPAPWGQFSGGQRDTC